MDKRSNPKKSKSIKLPSIIVPPPVTATPRMKSPTMSWTMMSRRLTAMVPRVPRSLPLQPPVLPPPPLGPRSVGPRPMELRKIGPRSLGPVLTVARPNMDMIIGEIGNSPLYGYMPLVFDEECSRRREVYSRTSNPVLTEPSIDVRPLLTTINNAQAERKIVSITYLDRTGGSMIVRRRRDDGNLDVRKVYSRDFMLAASASPLARLPPANLRNIALEMMEIVAKFPKSCHSSTVRDSESAD